MNTGKVIATAIIMWNEVSNWKWWKCTSGWQLPMTVTLESVIIPDNIAVDGKMELFLHHVVGHVVYSV